MTSSQEVLASPYEVPAGPGQRQHWADNLRVLVIAAVVVWHTAQAYLEGSSWYYMDRATSKVWTAAFYPAYLVSFLRWDRCSWSPAGSPHVPWYARAPVRSPARGCCGSVYR
jgi:hypothetical protein